MLQKFHVFALILLYTLIYSFDCNSQAINSLAIKGIIKSTPLITYLDQLSKDTNLRFFYEKKLLDNIEINSFDNGKLLLDFINEVLTPKGIIYILYKDNNLILLDRKQLILKNQAGLAKKDENGNNYTQVDVGDPLLAGKYKKVTLNGTIKSGKTGEPLPGATIYFKDLELGGATDVKGHFRIEIPVGKHEAEFAYVGFENKDLTINMISSGSYDVELFEGSIAIEQVVVKSNGNSNIARPEMGIIRMDTKTINSIPVLMGEPDLIKTMTFMPGVQSGGDMSSGFNVRGGNADQNLILIDDVPIYNSTHLFGMFSILDSRSIENIELYKGGAPASYGGRASSIMGIELKEGNNKEFEGNGGIGLYNGRLTLQGPIIKHKASFIISGRTTYSDWILKRVPDVEIRNSKANFYDVNAKLNYTLNRNNRVSIFGYLSDDAFNLAGTTYYQYGNKLASAKWSHIMNEKITFSLNAYYSNYHTKNIDEVEIINATQFTSALNEYGSKLRFVYSMNSKNRFEFGIEANRFKFQGGKEIPYGNNNVNPKSVENENSMELAGYLQDVIDFSNSISLSIGLRYSDYLYLGPKNVNIYVDSLYPGPASFVKTEYEGQNKIIKQYHGLEPRLGLRIKLDPTSSLKLAYSRGLQYLHILSNTSVMTPTDVWKSCDLYIQPAIGDQYVIGYFKNMGGGAYESSLEVYYKNVQNVLEYKNGAVLLLNNKIEQDILSANLKAYGAELYIKKNVGKLTGWLSYAYSRSFLKTSNAPSDQLVNWGKEYPSYYDKPHDLAIVVNYKLTRRFTFGSSFTYNTGRATTLPERKYSINGNDVVDYSDRNKYRLPDYHRLDLSLVWDVSLKKQKKYYSSWTLSVYNVYGRDNVYSVYYKKALPTSQNDYKTYSLYKLSIIGVAIPSLTYNFRF